MLSKYVMADIEKCSGCKACEVACFAAHNKNKVANGRTIGCVEIPVMPRLFVTKFEEECPDCGEKAICSMPVQCKHCEDAPCLATCEENAISRINNQVIINDKKCTGCKECLLVCPFGAIQMFKTSAKKEAVAVKCDLCIESESGPACVAACPNEALHLVDSEEGIEEKRIKSAMFLDKIKC